MMNNIGLVGLFALGAACVHAVSKNADNKRDTQLMSLAQGLYNENFTDTKQALIQLADRFGHQSKVQDCLFLALEDALHIFGDAKAIPLISVVGDSTRDTKLRQLIGMVRKDFRDVSREQAVAHDQAVRSLSEFLHKMKLPQIDFDEGYVGIKRMTQQAGATMMSPDQFLRRHDMPPVSRDSPSLRAG